MDEACTDCESSNLTTPGKLATQKEIDELLDHLLFEACEEPYTKRVQSACYLFYCFLDALMDIIDKQNNPSDFIVNKLKGNEDFLQWIMKEYNKQTGE